LAGAKIDIKIKDALKRKWQCATIQCDFAIPERFNLQFIDDSGKQRQPIMLHRVVLGSLERFIGVLVEHYAGSLPLWLSPTQVDIIPIRSEFQDQAMTIKKALSDQSIRSKIDNRNLTLEKRIREAEIEKIPYLLIIGEREVKSKTLSVRKRIQGDIGTMPLEAFINRLRQEINNITKADN
jgi:threonyl-tRNA synthetase